MTTTYRIDDRELLASVIDGEAVYLPAAVVVDGLTSHQAQAKLHGLPHSIAEIVAHMAFWQDWFNRTVTVGFTGIPLHAADGWPAVADDDWDHVRARFLDSLEEAKRIAATSNTLVAPLLPPDVHVASLARESHGSGILHGAVHNGHHLGQIITIRQLMGLWPPPGGTITW